MTRKRERRVWASVHPRTARWLDHWRQILNLGTEAVLDVLTSRSPRATELRQNSPFAGVLSEPERHAVLSAFTATWRRERAV